MVVPPSPSLFVSHFPVLISAPSHQHSSSSSSRMDARPLVGGTRPTTPPPKQNHIDMCTVRGWATTPRPPRPRHPPPRPPRSRHPPIPSASQGQPWPAPHTPRLGPSSAGLHPVSPLQPSVECQVSATSCRHHTHECPSRPPAKRGRHPRPSLPPPRVGHPCPRRRPLGPLRPSVESQLSGAYCQPRADESPRRPLAKVLLRPRPSLPPRDVECLCPRRPPLGPPSLSVESPVSVVSCRPRADGCPRPPRAKALLHPRPSLPPRRVERLYPPFSATMKKEGGDIASSEDGMSAGL